MTYSLMILLMNLISVEMLLLWLKERWD